MTAPQLSPGYVIAGKYSVQALLGNGGSSATYRVVDATGRAMAVRIYSPTIAQRPEVMTMIEQIYTATNGLPPDVVLPVLDAGYDPQTAAPFTVTELSPTPSLAQLVSQRPLSPQEVSQIAQNMARTLDNAHVRQLMHHALKPTNVFVAPQGFAVRIMDFGAGLARSYVQTNEGYAIAAPWVAPEQMQGGAPAGPAADVFAMGLVLFYALTGRPYWRSCQGAQPDLASWQHELVGPRQPASQRAQELGALVSPVLDAVFNRALAIDPNERFRQASELAVAFSAAANMPEMATSATIAFPAIGGADPMGPTAAVPVYQPGGQNDGSGYPPPPPIGGGGMGGAGMGGQGAGAPANADMGMGMGPGPMAPTTAAPRLQMDGGGGSKKLPIIIGVAAVLLIGGAVGAFIVMGGKDKPEGEDPNAPIAITPTGAPTTSSESGAPTGTGTGEAPPPTPPPAAEEVEVAIKCSPGCDTIKVDDKAIEDPSKLKLAPGAHKIELSKAGYVTQSEDITIEAGKKFEKEFKLAEAPKETAQTASTAKSSGSGGGSTVKTTPTATTKPTSTAKTGGQKCTGVGLFKKCK
ncbi:serine/threonine protein kinase [Polyangium mundeleinium]|uniref:Protein kinase n=1 Tax=Polyangium mundeleinium TaxID=2995306 RepID=A0ABT5F5G8_9BACT|nr:protein kinase [Polyangium mundeleinium]MDC0749346.1 protein kinase [Polyangium mundeleinium]